ncbi:MAG: 2-iminoacetate synthase ThiH [Deltaproteobacteria bacterium]|jgi:2-iminoacetate synthase|nr:2-iminoacetate synthase ThiH [Deltaproteobacteria bacterium]
MSLEELTENLELAWAFDFDSVTAAQAERVLGQEQLAPADLGVLLSPAAGRFLEPMAARAAELTARFFGRNINLFTPLYLANYCLNQCTYCGYSRLNSLKRGVLTESEIKRELLAVKATGLDDILLLTGESRTHSGPQYIEQAAAAAAGLFSRVGLEVYPLKTEQYARMQKAGADYVCVYQETYDPELYRQVHPQGPKKDYAFRLEALSRALAGGIRSAGLGALLGLGDFRRDVLALGIHGRYLARHFPASELAYSVPRLRPMAGSLEGFPLVSERELTQIILALRIFSPSFDLSLSTRERPFYRQSLIGLGITRLSAGVRTSVGGHDGDSKGGEQFEKADERSVDEVCAGIAAKGFQPVFTDYARL